jgi:hypothetical protein
MDGTAPTCVGFPLLMEDTGTSVELLHQHRDEVSRKAAKAVEMCRTLRVQLEALRSEHERVLAHVEELRVQLDEARGQTVLLTEQVELRDKEIQMILSLHDLDSKDEIVRELEKRIVFLEETNKALEGKLDVSESVHEKKEIQEKSDDSEILSLKSKIEELEGKVDPMEKQKKILEQQVEKLMHSENSGEDAMKALEKNLEDERLRAEEMRNKFNTKLIEQSCQYEKVISSLKKELEEALQNSESKKNVNSDEKVVVDSEERKSISEKASMKSRSPKLRRSSISIQNRSPRKSSANSRLSKSAREMTTPRKAISRTQKSNDQAIQSPGKAQAELRRHLVTLDAVSEDWETRVEAMEFIKQMVRLPHLQDAFMRESNRFFICILKQLQDPRSNVIKKVASLLVWISFHLIHNVDSLWRKLRKKIFSWILHFDSSNSLGESSQQYNGNVATC